MDNIHSIKTEKEYDEIMKKLIALAKADPQKGSPEYKQLMFLSARIEKYDRKHSA